MKIKINKIINKILFIFLLMLFTTLYIGVKDAKAVIALPSYGVNQVVNGEGDPLLNGWQETVEFSFFGEPYGSFDLPLNYISNPSSVFYFIANSPINERGELTQVIELDALSADIDNNNVIFRFGGLMFRHSLSSSGSIKVVQLNASNIEIRMDELQGNNTPVWEELYSDSILIEPGVRSLKIILEANSSYSDGISGRGFAFDSISLILYPRPSKPDSPSNVTAVAGNGQATVSFTTPTDNGGAPITGYTVTANPGGLTKSGTGNTITVNGLTNGTPYTFTVTATNSAGTSISSAPSNSVTPVAPITAPTAPTNVTAVAGNGQATVSFTTPTDNGGAPITGYTVTANPGGLTKSGTGSPITITGLENGTSYTFTVTATNSAGTSISSTASNSVTPVTPITAPDAPANVTAVAGNGQATVSFTTPTDNGGAPITSYTVTSNPGNLTATGTGNTITITGLENGTSYTFTVTATNSAGTSTASAVSNTVIPVAPLTAPAVPTNVTAVAGNGQAIVSFDVPVNNGGAPITGYTITSNPEFITITSVINHVIIPGLTNGVNYTFTVTATNLFGTSLSSVASNTVRPITVPTAPTNVTAVAGNEQAIISFDIPSNSGGSPITGYTVTSNPGGLTATGTGNPITINGLTNGVEYTFTVTATNGAGTSTSSYVSSSVTPVAPITAPAVPMNVTAVAGNEQAIISFDIPSNNGGSPITGYTVTSNPGGLTATGTENTITITGLTNGVSYTFTVTATNSAGTSAFSAPSNPVTPVAPIVSYPSVPSYPSTPTYWDGDSKNDDADTTDTNPEKKEEKSSSNNVLSLNKSLNATISGTKIKYNVDYSKNKIDLKLNISDNATWTLYTDKAATKKISKKNVKLVTGSNKFYIKVTAEDGTSKIYTLNITRNKSTETKIVKLTSPNNAVIKNKVITSVVSNKTTSINVKGKLSDGATWKVYSDKACKNLISNKIKLKVGNTKVYIKVTAQDGKTTNIYTMKITRKS